MAFPGARTAAALGVVVSAATGLVTNLITNRWSPTLLAALAVLIAVGAVLAVRTATGAGPRTRGRMIARRGGTIRGSGQTLSGGADVTTTAPGGTVTNSPITAAGGDYTMKAGKNSEIVDSPVNLTP
jgi:hypothetical protein